MLFADAHSHHKLERARGRREGRQEIEGHRSDENVKKQMLRKLNKRELSVEGISKGEEREEEEEEEDEGVR